MSQLHPQPDPADVEGLDPDVAGDDKAAKRLNLSTVQIGAAAAASVTSALAASFFGVAGTLIGAAVGSIVSTVAGAIYTESIRRAADRVKVTQAIVVAKVAPTGAVPSLRITEDALATQLGQTGPVTSALPTQTVRLKTQDTPPTMVNPAVTVPVGGTELGTQLGTDLGTGARVTWWRRRPVALVAMMLLGFLIALGVVTGIEKFGGGTLSGEKGSPSISRVFSASSSTTNDTPSESASPSATSSTESSQAPVAPTATAEPTAGTTPTTQPSASATTAPTASSGVDDSADPVPGGSAESRLGTDSSTTTDTTP